MRIRVTVLLAAVVAMAGLTDYEKGFLAIH